MRFTSTTSLIVFVMSLLPLVGTAAQSTYAVSWLGNSFWGGREWVQQDIEDIHVTEDGTVYTVVDWDEDGGEYLVFLEDDWKAKVLMYRWRPK
jgi:hypothetical protein